MALENLRHAYVHAVYAEPASHARGVDIHRFHFAAGARLGQRFAHVNDDVHLVFRAGMLCKTAALHFTTVVAETRDEMDHRTSSRAGTRRSRPVDFPLAE